MLREAAVQGVGITSLPIFYLDDVLKSGALIRILTDFTTWPERDIHAVYMPNRYHSTRLRLFVDHLTNACRQLPWEKQSMS